MVKLVISIEPAVVIGSPPCAVFSRIQQLDIHIHDEAWKNTFEEDKANAVLQF